MNKTLTGTYTKVPNDLINSKLHPIAKYLFIYFSSKPLGWVYLQKNILRDVGLAKDTYYKYVNLLISEGWVVKNILYSDDKVIGVSIRINGISPESSNIKAKAYYQKLQDPRWKAKRLEILIRDNHTCQTCKSKSRLQVHHLKYQGEPWEVDDEFLVTLCGGCHKDVHGIKSAKSKKA